MSDDDSKHTEKAESSGDTDEMKLNLCDLGFGPLSNVLTFLKVGDILSVAQVCTLLRAVASSDTLWKHKASETYPTPTVDPLRHYSSYRELVKDDNRANTSLFIRYSDLSSEYKHNTQMYYFECHILGLQWQRSTDTFRIFFDARGEEDLRNPFESSIGVTVKRYCPNRRELKRSLHVLQQERNALMMAIDDAVNNSIDTTTLRKKLTSNSATIRRVYNELHQNNYLAFTDLVTIISPVDKKYYVAKPGHYMGYLEFEGLHQIQNFVNAAPPSYPWKREASIHGLSLVFCYANPIPLMPPDYSADYYATPFFDIPPGGDENFESLFRKQGIYVEDNQPMQEMMGVGEDEEWQMRLWGDVVTKDILTRQHPPWFV